MEKVNIYTKIFALKSKVGAISKEETNPFFKSKYFDINGLIKHIEPLLQENRLVLTQPTIDGKVKSILTDIDNKESIESELQLPDLEDPQKLGSCITYYRRYTLQSLLGLQSEDDDGNKASAPKPKSNEKNWFNINSPAWTKAVLNKVPLDKIEQHYKVSKENKLEYLSIISE